MVVYDETVRIASKNLDPSQLANYLYTLAKSLHRYYHDIPILTATEDNVKQMRLFLIEKISELSNRA